MSILTDIYNTVAKFFRPQEEQEDASKSVATNRLKLVLMQDRTNLTPKILEQMRGELVELLSRYVEMDKELLELNFEQEGDQVALMLSIPVIRAKDEEEIEAALASRTDGVNDGVNEGVNEGVNDGVDAGENNTDLNAEIEQSEGEADNNGENAGGINAESNNEEEANQEENADDNSTAESSANNSTSPSKTKKNKKVTPPKEAAETDSAEEAVLENSEV